MFLEAREKLERLGEARLIMQFADLSREQQADLARQIELLDETVFQEQQAQLLHPIKTFGDLQPFQSILPAVDPAAQEVGEQLLKAGAAGCLLLAGGEGSRLGLSAPKGIFEIFPNKSLFQIFAGKVKAASRKAGRDLPVAVITSPWTDRQTRQFFEQHDNFGLKPDQLTFLKQQTLPLLDDHGHLFLVDGSLACGADGNGSALALFLTSGLFEAWQMKGVRYLMVVPIDNPLANPFDVEMTGRCARGDFDLIARTVERAEVEEKVGVFVQQGKRVSIVEYFELSPSEKTARLEDGRLRHHCANINLFCFAMKFVAKYAQKPLPLHPVYKAVKADPSKKGWKYERFLFDIIPFASHVAALLSSRDSCFAPLKGPEDIADVQAAVEKGSAND